VALLGCSEAVAPTVTAGDAGTLYERILPSPDAGSIPSVSVVAEAGVAEAGVAEAGVACPSRAGYFDCEGNVCDRSIQACWDSECISYESVVQSHQATDAASCGACPGCACLSFAHDYNCEEDRAGTVFISQAPCYGAPPVRLEPVA
jgi:hypothetical protein